MNFTISLFLLSNYTRYGNSAVFFSFIFAMILIMYEELKRIIHALYGYLRIHYLCNL